MPVEFRNVSPIVRQALESALADLGGPSGVPGGRLVIVGVHGRAELDLVVNLRSKQPDAVVVALLIEPSPNLWRDSLRAGAAAVVAEEEVDALTDVLQAVARGRVSLPIEVARELAAQHPTAPGEGIPALSDEELGWLRSLSEGITVAALARREGRSERDMYRSLGALYERMAVGSRAQALVRAAEWGFLSEGRRGGGAGRDLSGK